MAFFLIIECKQFKVENLNMSIPKITEKASFSTSLPLAGSTISLDDIVGHVARMALEAPSLNSGSSSSLSDKDLAMDVAPEKLWFFEKIELPLFRSAPGYPLMLASWMLAVPGLFEKLLKITPEDRGSAQVFKHQFQELVFLPFLKTGNSDHLSDFFDKFIFSQDKIRKITEKTLESRFEIRTRPHGKNLQCFNHRVSVVTLQPRAFEYFTRLLYQTGHKATSLLDVLQVLHIPRAPKESETYKKVWCLDQLLANQGLSVKGTSKYLVTLREHRWRAEEEYAILPIVEFFVGEIKYRLKSFSTINSEDQCIAYLVENTSLFRIQPPLGLFDNESITYFDNVDILDAMKKYIDAPAAQRKLLQSAMSDFIIELMSSLDSCIYEQVASDH
jgi:hypothetical protein